MRETAFVLALRLFLAPLILSICVASQPVNAQRASEGAVEPYLRWTASQAEAVGKSMFAKSRVGSRWGRRGLKTDRAINYRLAATWFTPEMIHASARLIQLRNGLTDDETRALVAEAEAAGDIVFMVELDAREGSGVIPSDWIAFLHAAGVQPGTTESVVGVKKPSLREVRVLQGVRRRDWAYDRFWVVFPFVTKSGRALFSASQTQAELVVRVGSKYGRVRFQVPRSIRE